MTDYQRFALSADSIRLHLGNRCESPDNSGRLKGMGVMPNVHLAANNWLHGDDGFNPTLTPSAE